MQSNHGLARLLWRFIRPEAEELIAYACALTAIVGIAVYQLGSSGTIGVDVQDIFGAIQDMISRTASYLSSGGGWARFFLFGFWFVVGAITYVIAWALITVLIDLYRDVVVSAAFVHPRSFHQSNYWLAIVAKGIVRFSAGLALLFYGIFWVVLFAPVAIDQVKKLIRHPQDIEVIGSSLLMIALVGITLHIGAILFRIVLLKSAYRS